MLAPAPGPVPASDSPVFQQAVKTRADADPSKNSQFIIVDGAQGGRDATMWLDPAAVTWTTVDTRLSAAGVTPNQVQVCWLKQANYAKKLGLPNFSSHQYCVTIRTELTDLSQVAEESARLYRLFCPSRNSNPPSSGSAKSSANASPCPCSADRRRPAASGACGFHENPR